MDLTEAISVVPFLEGEEHQGDIHPPEGVAMW